MKFTLSDDDEELFWLKMEVTVADAMRKAQIQKKVGGYSNGEMFRMVFRGTQSASCRALSRSGRAGLTATP